MLIHCVPSGFKSTMTEHRLKFCADGTQMSQRGHCVKEMFSCCDGCAKIAGVQKDSRQREKHFPSPSCLIHDQCNGKSCMVWRMHSTRNGPKAEPSPYASVSQFFRVLAQGRLLSLISVFHFQHKLGSIFNFV